MEELQFGFNSKGNLIEVMYNELDNNTASVFHAMKCRKAWRDLAKLEEVLWQK